MPDYLRWVVCGGKATAVTPVAIVANLTGPENRVKIQNDMYFVGCFLRSSMRESS